MRIVIILGNKRYLKGKILRKRLETSLTIPSDYIIVTGGNTTSKKGNHSEAFLMKQWLIQHKVPRDKIILEGRALDTIENAIYSKKITDTFKDPDITVVTSRSHTPRAKRIFKEEYGKNIKFVSS
tara:strand:+ start:603 stop:977 length:375 start_codon:yes stop_codon:yes gene_type:complete